MSEVTTGEMRHCKKCKKLLPIELFYAKCKRLLCRVHVNEAESFRRNETPEKRAFYHMWNRARLDSLTFHQRNFKLSFEQFKQLVNNEHIENYTKWAIIPLDPTQALCKGNMEVVLNTYRRYLLAIWKFTNDKEKFSHEAKRALTGIIEMK